MVASPHSFPIDISSSSTTGKSLVLSEGKGETIGGGGGDKGDTLVLLSGGWKGKTLVLSGKEMRAFNA